LGQLGYKQKSFLSRSQHHVERNLNSINNLFRRAYDDASNNVFKLVVQTKEGDSVTVEFQSSKEFDMSLGHGVDNFELSYTVEGELSEEEHKALLNIFENTGKLVDQYFNSNTPFTMSLLNSFDASQLSGVELTTGVEESIVSKPHLLDVDYDFDHQNKTQES